MQKIREQTEAIKCQREVNLNLQKLLLNTWKHLVSCLADGQSIKELEHQIQEKRAKIEQVLGHEPSNHTLNISQMIMIANLRRWVKMRSAVQHFGIDCKN